MSGRQGVRFVGEPITIGQSQEVEENRVRFGGYALKWDNIATIRDFFADYKEQFQRGAFAKTIKERGPAGNGAIKLLRQHNQRAAIAGRYNSLYEDDIGLAYEAETIDTSIGKDLAIEIRENTLHNMSIMFDAVVEEYDKDQNKYTVKEARLYEISPVLWGAYETSTIEMRSWEDMAFNLDRLVTACRAGRRLEPAQIGQLTTIREKIGQILHTEDSEPGEPLGAAPEEDDLDHAQDLELRLRFAEQELGLSN